MNKEEALPSWLERLFKKTDKIASIEEEESRYSDSPYILRHYMWRTRETENEEED
jgi:hypothetical protein